MTGPTCHHIEELPSAAQPKSDVCDQCVAMGDVWVHLRACLRCGSVGCCDQSMNRHARAHWEVHQHPLIQSIEPGEFWRFCFADQVVFR
jgi:monovalent cation/hydrogen antiporter